MVNDDACAAGAAGAVTAAAIAVLAYTDAAAAAAATARTCSRALHRAMPWMNVCVMLLEMVFCNFKFSSLSM